MVRLREDKYLLRVTQQGMGEAGMGALGFYLPAQECSLYPLPAVCPGWKCLGQLQLTVWGIISKEQRKAISGRKQLGWLLVAPRGAPEPKLQRDRCQHRVVGERAL